MRCVAPACRDYTPIPPGPSTRPYYCAPAAAGWRLYKLPEIFGAQHGSPLLLLCRLRPYQRWKIEKIRRDGRRRMRERENETPPAEGIGGYGVILRRTRGKTSAPHRPRPATAVHPQRWSTFLKDVIPANPHLPDRSRVSSLCKYAKTASTTSSKSMPGVRCYRYDKYRTITEPNEPAGDARARCLIYFASPRGARG